MVPCLEILAVVGQMLVVEVEDGVVLVGLQVLASTGTFAKINNRWGSGG